MDIKREEIIWLAGLLEGESCFSVGTRSVRRGVGRKFPRVQVNMCDLDVLEHARKASGGLGTPIQRVATPSRLKKEKEYGWTPSYSWAVQGETEAYALMVMVYPWMGHRRKARIRELIELFKEYVPDRHPNLDAPEGTHWCSACEEYRDRNRFSPNPQRSSGLASYCRRCRRVQYHATKKAKHEFTV